MKLYADDAKLYTEISDIKNVSDLQSGLDRLDNWSHEWQLCIAINKCSVLHIGKSNPRHNYNVQSASLKDETEVNDLGINIDHKLRFASHYASIVKKSH